MATKKRKPRPKFAPKPVPRPERPPPLQLRRDGPAIEFPAPVSRKRKSQAQREVDLAQAYRDVFGSPQGEMVKADLMLCGNVYHEISGPDLFALGIKEGERRVALRIAKMLGLRAEHFPAEAWQVANVADQMMAA